MGVARRAKSVIALILLLMLIVQLGLFFLIRYDVVPIAEATGATTQPTDATAKLGDVMHFVTGVSLLGGIRLGIVLAMLLMLIAHIMLVGRLIGVGKVTGSLVWCFILIVFLFPWQTFMNNVDMTNGDFRIPGVLWTWGELLSRVHFDSEFKDDNWATVILSWFRFVGAPLAAIIITLLIQLKSNRGIKMAMGEDEVLNEMMQQQ